VGKDCWAFFENELDEKISYEEFHKELLQNHLRIAVLARIEEEPKKIIIFILKEKNLKIL